MKKAYPGVVMMGFWLGFAVGIIILKLVGLI